MVASKGSFAACSRAVKYCSKGRGSSRPEGKEGAELDRQQRKRQRRCTVQALGAQFMGGDIMLVVKLCEPWWGSHSDERDNHPCPGSTHAEGGCKCAWQPAVHPAICREACVRRAAAHAGTGQQPKWQLTNHGVARHPPGMSQQRTVPSREAVSSQRQSALICMSTTGAVWPRNWRTRRAACGVWRRGGDVGIRVEARGAATSAS